MVINESAYYQGKLWCAYELKDHFGQYKEELRLTMRKESQERKFTCPDCGEPLILCAGPIMEPFFKHYENTKCIIDRKEVNRRNVVARRMLYHLAKDSFPEAELIVNQKLEEKVVPDIYIKTKKGQLVFEYLSYEIKLADWEKKHDFYQEHGIVDVWFLNYKRYQYETKTTFEYMVSKTTKVLKFIDYESGEILLKERRTLQDGRTKYLVKAYPVGEMRIDEAGEPICDYEAYRKEQLALWDYEDKVEQLRRYLEAAKRNGITRDTSPKVQYEQQSLFSEPIPIERAEPKKEEREPDVSNLFMESTVSSRGLVKRYSMDEGEVTSQTMKLSSIQELWELPPLLGKEWQVRAGNQKRYLYLKKLNQELDHLTDSEREMRIKQAIQVLEEALDATSWR